MHFLLWKHFSDALDLANEVLPLILPDDDDTRFELYMFRAKCFFDSRDVSRARQDAQMAVVLKPDNVDVQNLLAILNTPVCGPLL
uniref:Uncharacterized protein n=1 Tax=Ditylenchus dipsaci TaxID=166011 RepID=A0A915DEN3_9BILA